MFTDIVGYTAISQRDESLGLELLEQHRSILRPIFTKHNGKEIKTIGDAFLVEFESALEAVRSALEIQQTLHAFNVDRSPPERIELRIGIHLGDVVHDQNDVYGDAVNVASRIWPFADPGGITISAPVYEDVRNKVDCVAGSLGMQELKNVQRPMEIYKITVAGKQIPFPASVPTEEKQRIAVLPIANISPDPKDEYFAEGLTEELIATLSKIPRLRVIARTSVARYRNEAKSISEIGQELRISAALEGSVRKLENRLRATFDLVDVLSEEPIWTHSYEGDAEDIFEMQRNIAHRVAEALKLRLLEADKRRIEMKPTASNEAHVLYLRGLFHFNKGFEEGYEKAISNFLEALQKDPEFALAYSKLADSYVERAFFDENLALEASTLAKDCARKALELESTLADARGCYAKVLFYFDHDAVEAEKEFKKALEFNPELSSIHCDYAMFLAFVNKLEEASREVKLALDLDPMSEEANDVGGCIHFFSRNYDEAIEQFKTAIEANEKDAFAHSMLGMAYVCSAAIDSGLSELSSALSVATTGRELIKARMIYSYVMKGERGEATRLIDEMRSNFANNQGSAIALASASAVLGLKEEAFEWLGKAFDRKSAYLSSIGVDMAFDGLRADSRFPAFLRKIGLQ